MKEIKRIVDLYTSVAGEQSEMVLATLVNVEESSYRRVGARMLILENGRYVGGISGGCLEGDALKQAKKVILDGKPRVVTYDTRMNDQFQIGVGLGCEGKIDVLLQKVLPNDGTIMRLNQCLATRMRRVMITLFRHTEGLTEHVGKSWFAFSDDIPAPLNVLEDDVKHVLRTGRSAVIRTQNAHNLPDVLLECIQPNIRVLVIGDHYDIRPFLQLCRTMGWNTILVIRARKVDKELHALADEIMTPEHIADIAVDAFTAVVSMTHDYERDLKSIQVFRQKTIGYLGVLGPRRRFERMVKDLHLPEASLRHVRNPVGLHIGAESPEEIALSIVAEIVHAFKGGDCQPLMYKEGHIHDRRHSVHSE